MFTLPTLAALDLVLAAVAALIGGYHFWLFRLTRRKTERRWAGWIGSSVALYALCHFAIYTAWTGLSPAFLLAIGYVAISGLVHAVVAYAWALRGLAPRRGLWTLLVLHLFWCVIFFSPLGITGPISTLKLAWFDGPYPHPAFHWGVQLFMLYGITLTLWSTLGLWRNWRPNNWQRWVLPGSFLLWVVAGAYDGAIAAGLIKRPLAFFVEYGLLGTAAVMLARTIQEHAQLATLALQAKIAAEEAFKRLLQQSPEPILLSRGEKVLYLNDPALALLGAREPSELLEKGTYSLLHPDDRAQEQQRFDALRAGKEHPKQLRDRLLRVDGSYATAEVSVALVDYHGAPAVMAIAHDISEATALQAKMMAMDRMIAIGTLAAGVAHEINNPLAYVYANLELTLESLASVEEGTLDLEAFSSETRELLSEACEGVRRIKRIVNDLRQTAHRSPDDEEAESRGSRENWEQENIRQTLQSALRLTRNTLRHRAEVKEALSEVPPVLVPPGRLSQVFINLLTNAADALPSGQSDDHTITVRCFAEGGEVVCQVEDDGPGIGPKVLPHIFDAFYTTKKVGEGTGLGLSICRQIVSQCGGSLTVRTAPGQGCCFTLRLPPYAETVGK